MKKQTREARSASKHSALPNSAPSAISTSRRGAPRRQAQTRQSTCACCGTEIEHRAGRRPKFCSDRCRYREHAKNRTRKAFLTRDTGAPTKRPKIDSKNKALQKAKSRSRVGIIGPACVLEAELFDRAWESLVSSDGVSVEVSRLRRRALVSR